MLFAQNINISSYSYIEISISFDIIIENAEHCRYYKQSVSFMDFFGLEIAIISAIDPLSKCSLSFGLLGLVLACYIEFTHNSKFCLD